VDRFAERRDDDYDDDLHDDNHVDHLDDDNDDAALAHETGYFGRRRVTSRLLVALFARVRTSYEPVIWYQWILDIA
jgi:hypothetical protein